MSQSTTAKTTIYVGLDVHKDSIDIALAEGGRDGEVRHLGTVVGGLDVTKALRRLISAGHRPHVVYEAGPWAFVLQRHLAALGYHCEVVAPSSIPKRSGDRVKTDRRVTVMLARLAHAGELSAVRVPDALDEAIRDLARAREDAVREQRNARQRLKALLLRNGLSYAGKSAWTAAHLRWLGRLALPHANQQIAFQECLHAVSESGARIARLEQALRDVGLIAAVTLVAEIQDSHRFANPRQLMAYLGLVPSETPAASVAARAPSPRRATRRRGACWWMWRICTATRPRSAR